MASPMLSAVSGGVPDPQKQGKYTLHIGQSLLKPGAAGGAYGSVKYNYKPKQITGKRKHALTTSDSERYSLSITDNDAGKTSAYTYSGQRTNLKRSYVLIFDQSKQSCTLEPLPSTYTLNLRSTPAESSTAKLKERYKQIQSPVEREEEVGPGQNLEELGSIDDLSDPDGDNPYDFRHYLSQPAAGREASRSVSPNLSVAGNTHRSTSIQSARDTPLTQSQTRKSAPGTQKVARPAAKATPLTKKAPPLTSSKESAVKAKTPTFRLERKASTRPVDVAGARRRIVALDAQLDRLKPKSATTSRPLKLGKPSSSAAKSKEFIDSGDEDEAEEDEEADQDLTTASGGLEIDFGDALPQKKHRKLDSPFPMGAGGIQGGPISLRSAANSASPASHLGTPLLSGRDRKRSAGDGQVIEFGDSAAPSPEGYADADADAEGEEDDHEDDVDALEQDLEAQLSEFDADIDGDGDGDVEPIDLGSPAHRSRGSTSGVGAVQELEEENDDAEADLEAEMMQELAGQAEEEEEQRYQTQRADESSESEEE
ncbi:hypothetical protein LTS18_013936 [Coniosporium uncinatum]|uniref:Uncharacterized protein n=1 Tax=Coniosporium uncinatum TaxID=93489 RepID=A0ACC3DVA2_9PEZI|nr:hypothetical protein LTS18_013936 [Coniosporium uncinatum]